MKTQKETEKEIGKLTKENHTKYYDDSYGYDIEIDNDKKIEELKVLLQQSKEFIEMIDNFNGEEYTDKEIWEEIKKELKSSIIGSEELPEKIVKIIDPDNTFLNECENIVKKRFGSEENKKEQEKFKKIFERLPLGERKMPAVIIDGKVFTWEEAWLEIRDDKPLAKKIQERIEEINKNEK